MAYAPPLAALAGALIIAWMGDAATGRRGYFGASLVALTGAACGAGAGIGRTSGPLLPQAASASVAVARKASGRRRFIAAV